MAACRSGASGFPLASASINTPAVSSQRVRRAASVLHKERHTHRHTPSFDYYFRLGRLWSREGDDFGLMPQYAGAKRFPRHHRMPPTPMHHTNAHQHHRATIIDSYLTFSPLFFAISACLDDSIFRRPTLLMPPSPRAFRRVTPSFIYLALTPTYTITATGHFAAFAPMPGARPH